MTLVAAESWQYSSGRTIVREFTVTDENDDPVDITAMTVNFEVARGIGDTAVISTEDASATVTLTTPASGVFEIEVDGAVTDPLSGTYRFEVTLTDGADDISTLARGYVTFVDNLI